MRRAATPPTWTSDGSAAGTDIQPPLPPEEAIAFFGIFPDNRVGNRPYKVLFGQGDWTCSIADFTGTFRSPMTMPDRIVIPPNGRSFRVEFCTVAHWKGGEIVEEKLFYDKTA